MNEGQKNEKQRLLSSIAIRLLLMLGTMLILIMGTFAWFDSRRSVATVTVMGKPSDLAIVGPNEGELRLDMSPSDGDATEDEDGSITVTRLFGVKTKNAHWLEVAHTTNTDALSFKIFSATENADGSYTYNSDAPITGQYLNEISSGSGTASSQTAPYYGDNFAADDKVQVNAIPLYWMSARLPVTGAGISYYCLEATWKETDKETDVIYIFASDSVNGG